MYCYRRDAFSNIHTISINGLTEVIDGFKQMLGVPQCAGSIDGLHVPVTPPALNHTDYYDRKGWYLMLVQAVVDHELLFQTYVLNGREAVMTLEC